MERFRGTAVVRRDARGATLYRMPDARREMPAERAEFVARPVDEAIAALAARQHGVVARRQLAALGVSQAAISRRRVAGKLHRLHQGVYAVGHPLLSRHGHWLAAVLACGPGAALSHASGAALWEVRATSATLIDVSVPTAGGRRRPGLRIRRTPVLETTTKDWIAVTTVSQTLLDLAGTLPRRALERAIAQADIENLLDLSSLDALVRAHPKRRGAARLRAAVDQSPTLTRSELENRFLEICPTHDLPTPHTSAIVEGLEVDFLFPRSRLVVETDGWTYHRTRAAFERDRERDATLRRAGYTTLRFTDRQLADGAEVAATVGPALGMASSVP
jgi:very-short-patch-repair endonuclease